MTDGNADDAAAVPKLLEQIDGEISLFVADAASDTRPIYRALKKREATVVVPPTKPPSAPAEGDAIPQSAAVRSHEYERWGGDAGRKKPAITVRRASRTPSLDTRRSSADAFGPGIRRGK